MQSFTVVLLFATLLAVQGISQGNSKTGDFSSCAPFDMHIFTKLIGIIEEISDYQVQNRERSLTNLKYGLPPTEYKTVMHGVEALDKAYAVLKPAFPVLSQTLGTLSSAVPALTTIVSKYKAGSKITGLKSNSKELAEEMKTLYPVLNEALEQLTGAFPTLTDTLTILAKEVPSMLTAAPAINRYLAAYYHGVQSQLISGIPALGKSSEVFNEGILRFMAAVFPSHNEL